LFPFIRKVLKRVIKKKRLSDSIETNRKAKKKAS